MNGRVTGAFAFFGAEGWVRRELQRSDGSRQVGDVVRREGAAIFR